MFSIGDLVWFTPNKAHKTKPQKEKGVGVVTNVLIRGKGELTYSLYRVRWQKPENFRYNDCYDYQLVKVNSDA